MSTTVNVRHMTLDDIQAVAAVHSASFKRQKLSIEWITCNHSAFPRMLYFVAEFYDGIAGYIHWTQKSGFRKEAVLELEQIAVSPNMRNTGVGKLLIRESIRELKAHLKLRDAYIKNIIVTTRSDNAAQKLYRSELGAGVEAKIQKLYSSDEVIMIARGIE